MDVHTHGAAPRVHDLHRAEARRALTVMAKLALCLEPEFDQVSISVIGATGDVATWTEHGELAGTLDRLQHDLDEGPGLDSMRGGGCLVAPDIRHDDRWRRYGGAAADLGLRSQVSVPLRRRGERPMGSLSMYSTTDTQPGPTASLVAEVTGAQAATTLAGLREIESLLRAHAAAEAIGRATGMVMVRFDLDADHAMAHLRQVATIRDRTLAQIAEEMVLTRELPAVRQA